MVETLGVTRNEMVLEHRRQMERLINAHSHKENYYVLVHSATHFITKNIHDRYILTSQKPIRMLGTMLYYVDNKKGLLKRIWCLPLDRTNVIPDELLDKEQTVTMAEFTNEKIIQ